MILSIILWLSTHYCSDKESDELSDKNDDWYAYQSGIQLFPFIQSSDLNKQQQLPYFPAEVVVPLCNLKVIPADTAQGWMLFF